MKKRKPAKPVKAWAVVRDGQILVGSICKRRSGPALGSWEEEHLIQVEIREVVRKKVKP